MLDKLQMAEYNDLKNKYFLFCNTFYKEMIKPTIAYKQNNNGVVFYLYMETLKDFKNDKYNIPTGYKEVFISGDYKTVCDTLTTYANAVVSALKEKHKDYEKNI